MVKQYFQNVSSVDEGLKLHTLQSGDFIYWKKKKQQTKKQTKKPQEELLSTLLKKPLSSTDNRTLCHSALRNRILDSHHTTKESTSPA